jgi:hypothetical protein
VDSEFDGLENFSGMRSGRSTVDPRGNAPSDGGSEAGWGASEAPCSVWNVVGAFLGPKFKFFKTKYHEVGDLSFGYHAAVGETKEFGCTAGEDMDCFFDADEPSIADVVGKYVEMLTRC